MKKRTLIIVLIGVLLVALVAMWWFVRSSDDPIADQDYIEQEYQENVIKSQINHFRETIKAYEEEALQGTENEFDVRRITQYNSMVQEYREIVNRPYGEGVPLEDFTAQVNHLQDLSNKFRHLQRHLTPMEALCEYDIATIISSAESHKESLHGADKETEDALQQFIPELKTLVERIKAGELSLESAKREYAAILEKYKTALPSFYQRRNLSESEMIGVLRDMPLSARPYYHCDWLGIPDRYGERSSVSDAYYACVYYDITDTVEAVIVYNNDTDWAVFSYGNYIKEVYLLNKKTGEKLPCNKIYARRKNTEDEDATNDYTEYYITDAATGADITMQEWLHQ